MNFIVKTLLIVVGLYASINWAADNPASVDSFRHLMNEAVTSTGEWMRATYESW